jgi:DNA-binding NarL/FixJ family response regulator
MSIIKSEVQGKTIRVLLVDDDEQIQENLKQAIEHDPALSLLGQCYSVGEALAALEELEPDVALIDLRLPDGNGLDLIKYIHLQVPDCESMVLTVLADECHVIACIEAGATGYLTKDTRITEIVERLKQLRAGGSPISPLIARRLLNQFRGSLSSQPQGDENAWAGAPDAGLSQVESGEFTPLSDREQEVLEMVAKGFMQAEIASMLGVSINTVSTYVKRIYKKLAVNSRTSAVHRASELGLISFRDF